jgi:putative transposase
VPIGLAVEGANRNDFKMVKATLESIPIRRPKPTRKCPQGMCLDKGYDYDEARELVDEFGYTAHIRARGEEAQAIKHEAGFKARRWVVERTRSWMNRFRRILTRWEKKAANYLGLLHFVLGIITYRCSGLAG